MIDNDKLDDLIYKSIKIEDKPNNKLNNVLKERLYEQENMNKAKDSINKVCLLYTFMTLNIIFCIMIGIIIGLLIKNMYLYIIILPICYYISISGVVLTVVSIKRKDIKEILI